ncbi:MAG: hypothetical protein C4341_05580 [Armatimonadota bacterium]
MIDTQIARAVLAALVSTSAFLALGCSDRKGKQPEAPPVAVEYTDLPSYVGKRVVVRAWVLGHGDAFRTPGEPDDFYFLLVPDAEVDWKAFFGDYEGLKRLVAELADGDHASRADAKHVAAFSKLQIALQTWRGLILGQEARDDVTTWGCFSQNVIEGDFSAIPDGPLVLVTPTRGELLDSATRLLRDYEAIERSAEVEATGTLVRTGGSTLGENSKPPPAVLSKKPFLLHVESFKVLRRARDMLKDQPSVGAAPLAQPEGERQGGKQ